MLLIAPAFFTCIHDLFRLHLVRHKALRADATLAVARARKMSRPSRDQRQRQLPAKHVDLQQHNSSV